MMSFQLDYEIRKPNDKINNSHWEILFSQDALACSKCGELPAKFFSALHHVASCADPICRQEMEDFGTQNPEDWPEDE